MLELGAGKTGLAGLGVAACSGATDVVITDGNPDALRNLEVRYWCTPLAVHIVAFYHFSRILILYKRRVLGVNW